MIGYFFNKAGKYYTKIYLENKVVEEVVELVVKYKSIVPKIMVTDVNDMSVFEAENGEIIFPCFDKETLEGLDASIEPVKAPVVNDEFIYTSIRNLDGTAKLLCEAKREGNKILCADLKNKINDIERLLLAVAARDNINLFGFGYRPSSALLIE